MTGRLSVLCILVFVLLERNFRKIVLPNKNEGFAETQIDEGVCHAVLMVITLKIRTLQCQYLVRRYSVGAICICLAD